MNSPVVQNQPKLPEESENLANRVYCILLRCTNEDPDYVPLSESIPDDASYKVYLGDIMVF